MPALPAGGSGSDGTISIATALAQDKVMKGSGGNVSVALTLSAENIAPRRNHNIQPVDLAVVLDKSGSMNGQKINDAKSAVAALFYRLTP